MADDKNTVAKKKKRFQHKDPDQPLVLPQSVADRQRIQIEKLMRNPEKSVYIPEKRKDRKPREPPEFVRDVMGSSAGAGSGEFHVYRGYRRREYARQMYIQSKAEQEEQGDEFQKKMEKNRAQAEERTSKKRNKRLKKKQKLLEKKKQKVEENQKDGDGEKSSHGGSDDDEKSEDSSDEDAVEENCFVIGGR